MYLFCWPLLIYQGSKKALFTRTGEYARTLFMNSPLPHWYIYHSYVTWSFSIKSFHVVSWLTDIMPKLIARLSLQTLSCFCAKQHQHHEIFSLVPLSWLSGPLWGHQLLYLILLVFVALRILKRWCRNCELPRTLYRSTHKLGIISRPELIQSKNFHHLFSVRGTLALPYAKSSHCYLDWIRLPIFVFNLAIWAQLRIWHFGSFRG